ncbi:MAG: HAD-IA family hydrolase [OCS116 cluster bacterium]|uniref:HAD family hydrolase n=1 Tax=OCS116 cluster bacterium TaxID=2030921 RepID=A0A2A4Z7F0_9PROT|nr:HAD-IA family hydrolase [OCS116 cluster bacterium]
MQPKLVIFDLDGTLVDGARAAIPAMQHAFEAVGLPKPNDAQVMDMIGLSIIPAIQHILNSFNQIRTVSDSEVEQIGEIYKNYFYQSRIAEKHPMPLYDGALKALAELQTQDEILLGIATGNSRRGVNAFLDKHNLRDAFFTTQCASECPSKPHPEMILQAMRDAGVEAAQTIMIGDTSFDMQMAKAANVYAIGVNWGYHSQDIMLSAGADIIVDNFEQLTAQILEFLDVK